jgi:hypothetical protein
VRFASCVQIRLDLVQTTHHTGLVAEVPPKFARAGGSRPDFGPKKSKKTHKNTHKIKIKSKLNRN